VAEAEAKNVTSLIYFIVRVRCRLFKLSRWQEIVSFKLIIMFRICHGNAKLFKNYFRLDGWEIYCYAVIF
jgi:hypothetical protein